MLKYLSILFVLLAANASAQYTMAGKIEYERKVNVHKKIETYEEDTKRWIGSTSNIPKYSISYFDLYFNTSKSIYKPGRETDQTSKAWYATIPASENTIFTDFNNSVVKANKIIYEEKFFFQDTMRKLQWKIMDEIRTIANYKCRKAVARICDSVYVVAFYSEDIIASGGPEMFSRLPGMILEIAVPRLYATWVATKVELVPPNEDAFTMSEKGKKLSQQEFHESLQKSFKRWGNSLQQINLWWSTL